jgi:SAM-dependent methyltransferase
MAEVRDTAFHSEQFDAIYPPGVERHYWNRCRNRVIAGTLRKIGAHEPMLEVGCGKGLVVAALRAEGFDITGVELAAVEPVEEARPYVRTGLDVFSLPESERRTVRTILLLDVIEHIEDAAVFISAIRDHFPAMEWLVITVPAGQELFSNYDFFNGHFRRYDLDLLRRHADPERNRRFLARYFFHALYPAARMLLKRSGRRKTSFDVPETFVQRSFHALLGGLFHLEYKLLPGSWKGTSIIAAIGNKA